MASSKIEELIVTKSREGNGKEGDPYREVVQYFEKDAGEASDELRARLRHEVAMTAAREIMSEELWLPRYERGEFGFMPDKAELSTTKEETK